MIILQLYRTLTQVKCELSTLQYTKAPHTTMHLSSTFTPNAVVNLYNTFTPNGVGFKCLIYNVDHSDNLPLKVKNFK